MPVPAFRRDDPPQHEERVVAKVASLLLCARGAETRGSVTRGIEDKCGGAWLAAAADLKRAAILISNEVRSAPEAYHGQWRTRGLTYRAV
jgi:hypothetical protein